MPQLIGPPLRAAGRPAGSHQSSWWPPRRAAEEAQIRRWTAVLAAQDALVRVPQHRCVDEALAWVAGELIDTFGFDRVMALRLDGGCLHIRDTRFRGHPELALAAHRHAETWPIELHPHSLETEMLRRRAPALVLDPIGDDQAWQPIVAQLDTDAYVACPIVVAGRAVATLHADAYFSGRRVDEVDRDVMAIFAQVCSLVLERALLAEELTGLRAAVQASAQHLAGLAALTGAPEAAVSTSPVGKAIGGHRPQSYLDAARLTPRETEILRLMAAGATGPEIAQRLVVSPGTVKTHAKHILRKLGASNRAEAVARFLGPDAD